MLESRKISRRQSEIRQQLAGLVGKDKPTEDETRSMETLDTEYRQNETRYRAALIAEDTERREAKGELETRSEKEYGELVDKFELRQVALHLDEGKALDGATAEVVQELRAQGGYRGVPVPFAALELRAGETVASGVPAPKFTAPVIDRIFPKSVAVAMGAQIINVPQGSLEYPVTTSSISAAWAATETASVGNPQVYAVTNKPMTPAHTLGVQVVLTRKSMLQAGDALEAAVRRDLGGAISQEMDKAVMRGTNSAGEPDGVLNGNYGDHRDERQRCRFVGRVPCCARALHDRERNPVGIKRQGADPPDRLRQYGRYADHGHLCQRMGQVHQECRHRQYRDVSERHRVSCERRGIDGIADNKDWRHQSDIRRALGQRGRHSRPVHSG